MLHTNALGPLQHRVHETTPSRNLNIEINIYINQLIQFYSEIALAVDGKIGSDDLNTLILGHVKNILDATIKHLNILDARNLSISLSQVARIANKFHVERQVTTHFAKALEAIFKKAFAMSAEFNLKVCAGILRGLAQLYRNPDQKELNLLVYNLARNILLQVELDFTHNTVEPYLLIILIQAIANLGIPLKEVVSANLIEAWKKALTPKLANLTFATRKAIYDILNCPHMSSPLLNAEFFKMLLQNTSQQTVVAEQKNSLSSHATPKLSSQSSANLIFDNQAAAINYFTSIEALYQAAKQNLLDYPSLANVQFRQVEHGYSRLLNFYDAQVAQGITNHPLFIRSIAISRCNLADVVMSRRFVSVKLCEAALKEFKAGVELFKKVLPVLSPEEGGLLAYLQRGLLTMQLKVNDRMKANSHLLFAKDQLQSAVSDKPAPVPAWPGLSMNGSK